MDLPEMSLWGLRRDNPFRLACLYVVRSSAFESTILLAILANCLTLALGSARVGFDDTQLGMGLNSSEYFFLAIFSLEAVLKIISLGFVAEKGTYLRDGAPPHSAAACPPLARAHAAADRRLPPPARAS
jgi:hypothetical protein